MIEDIVTTVPIPVVTGRPPWQDETPPASARQLRRRRVRPCPHCRRRRRAVAITALAVSGLLAFSALGYAVVLRAPVPAAMITARPPATLYAAPTVAASFGVPHPRVVMPATTPPTTAAPTPTARIATPAATTPPPSPTPAPTTAAPSPSEASTTPPAVVPPPPSGGLGAQLLAVAEREQGVPYVFGGDTPAGFDCSGLVYWAALQLGITLPRDTFGMLAGSPHLVAVSSPEPGDLAFFGSGHVELYVRPGVTFGAQQAGTLVGPHDYGNFYVPTVYLRLV